MGVQVDTTFKICDRDLNKLTLGLNSPGAHYHPLSVNNWSFPAARRRVLERHAWATWISLDSVNPNWIAIFLDSVYDGFWANPSDHDAYWCLFFARHADNAALANRIQHAAARPALRTLLEAEAERRGSARFCHRQRAAPHARRRRRAGGLRQCRPRPQDYSARR